MKKILALILMAVLVFTLFSGCSKPTPAAPAEPSPAPAPAPAVPEAPAAEEVTDKDGILKLIGGSADVMKKGISYDYLLTAGTQTTGSRISFKDDNVRMEGLDSANPTLTIKKGREMFIINPQEKTGFKISTEVDSDANPTGEIKPEENMDKNALKIIGKETVNGEPCYIVTTKNVVDGSDMKMWIHQKYGIMMKMEAPSAEGSLLVEVKNLKVGDVPDSQFDIPSDIKMMEMPAVPSSY